MKLKAYAKINLSLKIIGKRPDGYHEIESVMQSISLCDRISLETLAAGIQLTCLPAGTATSNSQLPTDNKNLAYKAAQAILDKTGQKTGVKIKLEKNIPLASGLAGGSADAAAVLIGLNKMLGDRLSKEELLEIGASIGSDVPFCLVGGNAVVKGKGDILERRTLNLEPRTSNLEQKYYVLVTPPVGVSSKWAYEEWDRKTPNSQLPTSNNDLESIVIGKYPVVGEVKNKLLQLGCAFVQMSGSGSSVFGVVEDPEKGKRIALALKREYPNCFLVEKVDRGVEEDD